MAKELSSEEVKNFQETENKNLDTKQRELIGKKKKPFRHFTYGPGVMPQKDYDKLRDYKDPDYKE